MAAAVVTGLTAGILAGQATARLDDPERSGRAAALLVWFRSLTRLEVLALVAFAAVSVRQFGWLLFEPFVIAAAGLERRNRDKLRRQVQVMWLELVAGGATARVP